MACMASDYNRKWVYGTRMGEIISVDGSVHKVVKSASETSSEDHKRTCEQWMEDSCWGNEKPMEFKQEYMGTWHDSSEEPRHEGRHKKLNITAHLDADDLFMDAVSLSQAIGRASRGYEDDTEDTG